MIEIYGHFISSIDPWWLVAFGVGIYIVDFLYTRTDVLMCVGLAALFQVVPNALELNENLQAWMTLSNILVSILAQGWIANRLKSSQLLPAEEYGKYVGNEGIVVSTTLENEPQKYYEKFDFFQNRSKMQVRDVELKSVQLLSGDVFPLSALNHDIPCGMRVTVIQFDGVEMKVREKRVG